MNADLIAVVISSVSTLAGEYGKGALSEAGKATWGRIAKAVGWSKTPDNEEIKALGSRLKDEKKLAKKLGEILEEGESNHPATTTYMKAKVIYTAKKQTFDKIVIK